MSEQLQRVSAGAEPRGGVGAWFGGRANRKEYWLWIGPVVAAGLVAAAFVPAAAYVMSLITTFVWIRRFHDLGRTGWWAAAINVASNVAAFAGAAVAGPDGSAIGGLAYLAAIIVMGAVPGQDRDNAFGPSKGRRAQLAETFS